MAQPTARSILIGHSLGAVIAQQYVQTHQAAAIVMIAPTPLASMPLEKPRWALRFPVTTAKMILLQDVNCALPALRHLFFSRDTPVSQINEYMGRMQRESNRVFRDIARIRDSNPQSVRLPTLILAAEQDGIPTWINERLAISYFAELQTLPVSHDVMLTPQWQLAAHRIVEWIMAIDTTIAG